MVSTVTNNTTSPATASSSATSSALAATSGQTQSANFLQLLVAQLNNQDPMNPMDNAEMTSQIAQINTVTGIQQLNTTLTSMSTQFTGAQVMQGSSMIGHNVVATGNTLAISNGTGSGALNLASAASNVTVSVTTPGGQVLDTLQLGAMAAGNHNFTWPNASTYTGTAAPIFTVSASQAGQAVTATPLLLDTVAAVGTDSTGAMNLTLQSGNTIPYSTVQQIF
jgi:flagellar basal-body rod modification protein FlgD